MFRNYHRFLTKQAGFFLLVLAISGCQAEALNDALSADTEKLSFGSDAKQSPDADPSGVQECTEGADENDPCLFCTCTEAGERSCAPMEVGNPCESANCCLEAPTCQPCEGDDPNCKGSGLTCRGASKLTCDTDKQCSVVTAACLNGECSCMQTALPDSTPCVADPNECTEGDSCQNGNCVAGPASALEDDNPCTSLVCIKGTLETKLLEGDCSDGNPCTIGDSCALGQCVPDSLVECPQSECAQSFCDPGVGECVSEVVAKGSYCTDDDPCVVLALCKDGMCLPEIYRSCNDGDPCTTDGCSLETGECFHTTISPCSTCTSNAECDDGDACNGTEVCDAASGCQLGSAPSCDDGDECTEDNCDPDFGCVYSQIEGCGEPPIIECTGSSLELDGSSCVVVKDILNEKIGALTIEFWIDLSDPDLKSTLLDKRAANLNGPGFEIRANFLGNFQEKLHYDENTPPSGSASGMFTKAKFATGEWHHFAMTRSEPEPIAGFASCQADNECAAACNAKSGYECVCVDSPLGDKDCLATCNTHTDCPSDGPGKNLVCVEGTCRRYKVSFKLYVDGQIDQGSNWQGSFGILPNQRDLNIGCRGDASAGITGLTQFFLGRLEELRISDSKRYSGNFEVAKNPFEADANTIALYHFEEESGAEVLDSSGNNHHGTWIGTPLWSPYSPLECLEDPP